MAGGFIGNKQHASLPARTQALLDRSDHGHGGGVRDLFSRCPGRKALAGNPRLVLRLTHAERVDRREAENLVREDGVYMYPIRDDIPIMLIDEAIPLEQLQSRVRRGRLPDPL